MNKFHWTDFHEISYVTIFRKSAEKFQISLKSDKNNGHYSMTSVEFYDYISLILFRMRNVADKNYRENQNTRLVLTNIFFSKMVPLLR